MFIFRINKHSRKVDGKIKENAWKVPGSLSGSYDQALATERTSAIDNGKQLMKIEELKNRLIPALGITLRDIEMEAVNDILDNRDGDLFSEAWSMAYEQTKDYKPDSKLEEEINEIRELIFKQVFRMTGSPDLSAYISDDFELIVIHNMCDTNNKWVHKLSETYLNYEIPQ